MSLPELCIRRPVMTTLLMLAFVIFGLFSYRLLPVAAIPTVDFPTIVVNAQLPGASPATMASSVATPLERQFSTIAGLNSMVSSSGNGITSITMQFDLSRDIDGAALDVQSALTSAAKRLPIQMTTPPSFIKANPADAPVIFLNLSSATLPLSDVDEYAETLIAQRISTLPGVSQVLVMGQQKFAVRIQANPEALASKGMTLDDLQSAVAAANSSTPVGQMMQGETQAYTLQANAQLPHAAQYTNLIVAYRNGSPVRLKDVATAVDSTENDHLASWYNGQRGILLGIQRQPDSNTVQVVDSVKALLPIFEAQLPASVKLNVLLDHSVSIRNSVNDVQFTLLLTAALVVLVIFIFLRNVTATIIPALALPVSVIGTFAGMEVLGYSIDNLSLMALTLSVGFVVDDAIVMLENIVRHVEGGERVMEAAFRGSREIAFTILSITISLVAVFIPVLFMGGVVGRVFREFAMTISMTILISGFVSLTLTPMLASRLLKAHHGEKHNALYRMSEAGFNALFNGYRGGLVFVLRWRRTTLFLTLCSLGVAGYLFATVPKGFFPIVDTGTIIGYVEAAQDISAPAMAEHTLAAAKVIQDDPNVKDVTAFNGVGGSNQSENTGGLFIQLKPRNERSLSATEVIQELRPKMARVTGVNAYFQPLQDINLGGRPAKAQYQYTLQDGDTGELYKFGQLMRDRIAQLKGVQDVNSDLQLRSRLAMVNIDRDKAAQLGITVDQVRNTFYSAFGTRQISTIYEPANSYEVILELQKNYQTGPNDLSKIYLKSSTGQPIPLDALATVSTGIGPVTVNHQGELPSVTISFNLQPGFPLGTAVNEIAQLERDVNLPVTVSTSYQGNAQVFQQALQGQGLLLSAAIIVIYIVLGILYESFIHPVTILSGLPAAALGALLTLMLFHQDMSVIAIIGIVMLIGIVKKNAIMMIDFALQRQQAGSPAEEAIFEACCLRFRPIMMTTMAAIMGGLPIAVGWGEGAELRRPLGLVVVGGLVVSQSLTLFITPVIYLYLEKFRLLFSRGRETVPAHGVPDSSHAVREAGE
ncbi:MAG TPA: efflux RND transporter permease subunit [Stellaceae bacterium]|jgi:HAE1 family hydrophobic/amphiphilic exporter-1|nr:efflux RND transporter permease subunit [Stellaceae bacterium]